MPDNLTLDQQLCFALYGASIAINRAYKPLLDELQITYPQYLVLSTLWEEDGLAVGAIADKLALESSTITPLLKRLEAAGFVLRERNPKDERQVQVRLTDAGREMQANCRCISEMLSTSSGMSDQKLIALNLEVRQFRDAVARYLAAP